MDNLFKQAIAYVKDNVNRTDVMYAYDKAYECHSSLQHVNPNLGDKIYDLMEEFGEDNNLPEGWWLNYGDEEDVFFEVVDLFSAEKEA